MGKLDILTKEYISDKDRFAELFNHFVFNGDKVVNPNHLIDEDTTEIETDVEKSILLQKYRDNIKLLKSMTDGKMKMLLLGVENQTHINYAMPVRVMEYDAIAYNKQVKQLSDLAKKDKVTFPEFKYVSGIPKDSKLIPVITLVVYWKADPWDGPRTLFEMFDKDAVDLYGKYIEDYKMNLICPNEMTETELLTLKTDLQEVMSVIKYSNNAEKFDETISNNQRFKSVDRKTVALINEATGANIPYSEEEEKVNMCKAIEEIKEQKEKEAIVKAYKSIKAISPDAKENRIIKELAEQFNKTQKVIKSFVL